MSPLQAANIFYTITREVQSNQTHKDTQFKQPKTPVGTYYFLLILIKEEKINDPTIFQ